MRRTGARHCALETRRGQLAWRAVTGRSLTDVLADLDGVVADAAATGTALGYFPAMYRSVTASVDRAVMEGGFFDDDVLVERLAVTFADLYLDAYQAYRVGGEVPESWRVAFDAAADRRRRMILQHLLLGMNAHINLDLGVASVRVAGPRLPVLYGDFVRVNEILFRMLDDLQAALGVVSPRLRNIDRLGVGVDEWLMRMSIRTARDLAWRFADDLHCGDCDVADRDGEAAMVARLIAARWTPMHLFGRFVAAREPRDPAAVIEVLRSVRIEPADVAARAEAEIERDPDPAVSLTEAVRPRRLRRARR